jgi:hypothetical protein
MPDCGAGGDRLRDLRQLIHDCRDRQGLTMIAQTAWVLGLHS